MRFFHAPVRWLVYVAWVLLLAQTTTAADDAVVSRFAPTADGGTTYLDQYIKVRDFDDLKSLAQSASLYDCVPTDPLPQPLDSWSYDDYIKVGFRHRRATWWNQGLPFWFETFHRGFVQVDRVELFTLIPSAGDQPICQRIKFSKKDFEYQSPLEESAIPAAGHAGVKLIGQFPGTDRAEEVLSFLGSSYFRGRSGDCVYGASARGIAIDIAMQKVEEFPDFRAFWITLPAAEDDSLTILAHLDSPSVSGAYRFRLFPGETDTRLSVEAELYFRRVPDKVAYAPLTSMWMWGDGLKGPPKDARPGVHDSDGLLIRTDQLQWRWRPFARQDYPSVTSTEVEQLLGFGLIQRNRAFFHYDDHNARYDMRPSLWVVPKRPWTEGSIELLELPGAHEGVDNLGAYWLPKETPEVGQPVNLEYDIHFFAGDPPQHNALARATNLDVTRPDRSVPPKQAESSEQDAADARATDTTVADAVIGIEVRFAGPSIRGLPADSPPQAQTSAVRGVMKNPTLKRTEQGDWILRAEVIPEGDGPVELEVQLISAGEPVSEQWTYLLPPWEPSFVYPAVYTRQE
ncbi:glucan biosynthesis protein [Crateriforma spongiae]|uniref:glucan biosynthesis protein n=1 Tax=Crateriforma spongiae TaxID=2724528 RepID=UPI0014486FC7|nr:glucan biosynthesis protein [Crateriforma spongiae]